MPSARAAWSAPSAFARLKRPCRRSAIPSSAASSADERDRVGKLLRQPPSVVVADVDDRERPRLDEEEPPLRLEVRLHVAVKIEVVLAEIREHEHREAHTVEPMQDGRV